MKHSLAPSLLLIAGAAGAMENAVLTDQAHAAFVIGAAEQQRTEDFRASIGVQSKFIDQGALISNDATLHANLQGRYYGLGVSGDGYFMLGEDPNRDKTSPGEMIGANLRFDYAAQINWSGDNEFPFVLLRPYFEVTTYPDQSSSYDINGTYGRNIAKQDQQWLGADAWITPPLEGFEGLWLGGGMAWTTGTDLEAYRGAIGALYFRQRENLDFGSHALFNFGNREWHEEVLGVYERQGLTTFSLGLDLTTPMIFQDWWMVTSFEWQYWLNEDNREAHRASGGDSGEILIGISLLWEPN